MMLVTVPSVITMWRRNAAGVWAQQRYAPGLAYWVEPEVGQQLLALGGQRAEDEAQA
jgi:hypothetical protein